MDRRASFVHRSVLVGIVGVAAAGLLCGRPAEADDPPIAAEPTQVATSRPADPARADLDAGWEEVRVANWTVAAKALAAAEQQATTDEIRAETLFALAHVWQHRQPGADAAKARSYCERLIADYPNTKAAPWAKLALARIIDTPEFEPKTDAELDRRRTEAQRRYREILADHPGHLVAHEAALRLGVTYLSRRGNDEAERTGAEILIAYVATHPDNYLAAQMNVLVGEWHQRNGRDREAADAFIAGYESGLPSMLHRAKTCFRIAQIAEFRLGDDALAATWYQRLQDEAPEDDRYYMARLGAQRCRDRLAQAAERAAP